MDVGVAVEAPTSTFRLMPWLSAPPVARTRLEHAGHSLEAYAFSMGVGEGPHWSSQTGYLLWADIPASTIHRLYPGTGAYAVLNVPWKASTIVPRRAGGIIMAGTHGIAALDSSGGLLCNLPSPAMRDVRCNDGKCDAAGRLWFGTVGLAGLMGRGRLYCLGTDAQLREVDDGFDVCNGLGWSPAGEVMYFTDTARRTIFRYTFDLGTGSATAREPLIVFDAYEGKPDGLAVDRDGFLWCAMWDGWGLQQIDPQGRRAKFISLPVPRPTSCAFGGSNFSELFVTTARSGLTDHQLVTAPLSGAIFALRGVATGMPAGCFGG